MREKESKRKWERGESEGESESGKVRECVRKSEERVGEWGRQLLYFIEHFGADKTFI